MDLEIIKKSQKKMGIVWSISHFLLRLIAFLTSVLSALILFKNHQTLVVSDFVLGDIKYSDDPNSKFFALANAVVACFSGVALILSLFILCRKTVNSTLFFCFFIHDLMMVTAMGVACGVATAIGYEGKYGNSKAAWMPICPLFGKYCDRMTKSVFLSYSCLLTYFFLSISCAQKSRKT